MTTSGPPELVIRLGSHAEKEYVTKLARFLDGLIVGANLFESTPGATASLLVSVGAKNTHLFVDPMTYAFGAYADKETGALRTDLDWIKSDQTRKDKKTGAKKTVRDFKSSYRKLSEKLGEPVSGAIQNGAAVGPNDLADLEGRRDFCRRVVEYQTDRIVDEFRNDEELKDYADDAPRTAAVFAPYFYVEPSRTPEWLDLNVRLIETTASLNTDLPVHGVVCANVSHLADSAFTDRIEAVAKIERVKGIWLWFSGFFEDGATEDLLRAYRRLVSTLSDSVSVYAMHGGFFSLALRSCGMTGVSHGVGYGEQKDVVPVIGQSTPTVRYYLPALSNRLGVPEIERAFDGVGVVSVEDFHEKVCGCAVCRGIVVDSLRDFSAFGEMHYSRPQSKRMAQTPAAAKRCRFHFLLCRIRERDQMKTLAAADVASELSETQRTWGAQPSLDAVHLERWRSVLLEDEASG